MKNIFKTLLSLFGFGNKNKETKNQEIPSATSSRMNYWEAQSRINTTTIREFLLNAQPESSENPKNPIKNPKNPIKYDITQLGECDFSIDINLILPYRSQTEKVQQLLLWNTFVSENEANKAGLPRLSKIVHELRKKGWGIKTFLIYKNGKKQDVLYLLVDSHDDILAGETAVVK